MMEVKAKSKNEQTENAIWWSEYAKRYDEFVVPLTCYQDNINQLLQFLENTAAFAT